ncbi:MAG: shikimate kinase [Chloroflexota bacterium]|nr:shikimate kinase [Chloroflexota bacterium]
MKRNIFLTGFSGTGKTTVGREAARILGWQFVDLDERIEADEGTTIDAIFAEHGEPHFRAVEAQTLLAACESERQVVSTGGGIAESADNRAAMMQHGAVVCLEATPETIFERVLAQSTGDDAIVRPMLAANDPLERIRSLKSLRQLNYTLAHWTVHTDILTPEQAAHEVVRAFDILNEGDTTICRKAYPDWIRQRAEDLRATDMQSSELQASDRQASD